MALDREDLSLLRRLLSGRRTLALALVADGEPIVGLLPFAVDLAGAPALLVHASQLARHARGLREGARFDALVADVDDPAVDPLAVPRATLRGRVAVPADGSALHGAARAAYVGRFPSAEPLMDFGDFSLFRLEIEGGRLVAGFAAATDLAPSDVVQALAPS
jgi:putative heme iron utilization protein